MGIKGLFPFISESAPLAVKETKMEAMTGRVIAIDASMCLYQFLVAVRQGAEQSNLSNAEGEVTSHIQGFLARTVKLLELGARGRSCTPCRAVIQFCGRACSLCGRHQARLRLRRQAARAQVADARGPR
jgi:hypothetical protein